MKKISAIVVEDEPLAREGLLNYIREVEFIQVVSVCENALEANTALAKGDIDLMFLDIQMPKLTGIDFLKTLTSPPMVILTTAYPNFALQGYELDVLDYLVKPFPFERFLKAVNKARDYSTLKNRSVSTSAELDYFFVKCEHRYEKINFRDIRFIEGMENYVVIHTTTGKYMSLMRMKVVEEALPAPDFMRIHKSYIVSVPAITAVDGNDLVVGEKRLPVSRDKKMEIMDRLLKKREDDKKFGFI